ncbi:hypothetical protein ES703_27572 [subsurface metagenome]
MGMGRGARHPLPGPESGEDLDRGREGPIGCPTGVGIFGRPGPAWFPPGTFQEGLVKGRPGRRRRVVAGGSPGGYQVCLEATGARKRAGEGCGSLRELHQGRDVTRQPERFRAFRRRGGHMSGAREPKAKGHASGVSSSTGRIVVIPRPGRSGLVRNSLRSRSECCGRGGSTYGRGCSWIQDVGVSHVVVQGILGISGGRHVLGGAGVVVDLGLGLVDVERAVRR